MTQNVCVISKLDLRLRKTSHDILYAILGPIISSRVKTEIEAAICSAMKLIIEKGSLQAKQAIKHGIKSAQQVTSNLETSVSTRFERALE